MKTTSSEVALALLLLGGCGAAERADDAGFDLAGRHYPAAGLTQWALPDELREVSGLALSEDGRLFAHGDEQAVIYELDFVSGRAVKRFAFGNPAVPGDFEGIAFVGPRLFLITSSGDLLEGREGAPGEHVLHRAQRTGLGERCEIEGLDYDPGARALLILCKQARQQELAGAIAVLAWSPETQAPVPDAQMVLPWMPADGEPEAVNPSALTRSAAGTLVLAAARQGMLIEVDARAGTIHPIRLADDGRHPQAEGIALAADGTLLVADEGRRGRGRLSAYRPD
ncbi:MAG: hypothetical protein GVY21_06030 [Gammaproteobacteria bacterium]|jgi:uncharacterized protein YjiK|nr:hypothetical protein [Gammaproteobacteria bacterium]